MRRRETVGLDRWNAGDSPAHKASVEKTPGGQRSVCNAENINLLIIRAQYNYTTCCLHTPGNKRANESCCLLPNQEPEVRQLCAACYATACGRLGNCMPPGRELYAFS